MLYVAWCGPKQVAELRVHMLIRLDAVRKPRSIESAGAFRVGWRERSRAAAGSC